MFTKLAPALAILIAHSATGTPAASPFGPMHIVAATDLPYSKANSMAHSISSTFLKYFNRKKLYYNKDVTFFIFFIKEHNILIPLHCVPVTIM
jgi:hypothetical protein